MLPVAPPALAGVEIHIMQRKLCLDRPTEGDGNENGGNDAWRHVHALLFKCDKGDGGAPWGFCCRKGKVKLQPYSNNMKLGSAQIRKINKIHRDILFYHTGVPGF